MNIDLLDMCYKIDLKMLLYIDLLNILLMTFAIYVRLRVM